MYPVTLPLFKDATRRSCDGATDAALDEIALWIRNHCGSNSKPISKFFGEIVRRAVDEVIDGPRTGRWSISQLEKTEKTYIGTKVEILVRSAFDLDRSGPLDFEIMGHPVDVKWSMSCQWEIPTEAVNHLCLLIGMFNDEQSFCVGLIRCEEAFLNQGKNKDGKRTLSKLGRRQITWLVRNALDRNFIAALDPQVRAEIWAGDSAQERIRRFVRLVPKRPFPRHAIETVARSRDPLRRVRKDKGKTLAGMQVLSERYDKRLIARLGYAPLNKDEFISISEAELAHLDRECRRPLRQEIP
jgi:hypothetical protein